MPDDRKRCWLMEGCPSRTGVCYSCVPDGDDCPIWRWFKKQIVVRCKDCKYWVPGVITDRDDFIPPKCGKYSQMVGHSADDFCSLAEQEVSGDAD